MWLNRFEKPSHYLTFNVLVNAILLFKSEHYPIYAEWITLPSLFRLVHFQYIGVGLVLLLRFFFFVFFFFCFLLFLFLQKFMYLMQTV